jgi:hypothetical protein
MKLELQPVTFAEASEFIRLYHRHHHPTVSHKFSIAVNDGDKIVGVIVVGRPIARSFDNGYTAEVTRCCTDGTKMAASMLYAAAWRAARAMGYRRIVTYTLVEEPGTSLCAAGFREIGKTKGGSWNCPSRPRIDKAPTGQKTLWEITS